MTRHAALQYVVLGSARPGQVQSIRIESDVVYVLYDGSSDGRSVAVWNFGPVTVKVFGGLHRGEPLWVVAGDCCILKSGSEKVSVRLSN